MKKLISIFLILLIGSTFSAQNQAIEVIDENNKPISKVLLINSENKTIAISEEDGHIHFQGSASSSYTLKKLGYNERSISNIQDHQVFTLSSKKIKEVEIKGKKEITKKIAGSEIIDKCELGKLACCNLAESFENSNTVDVNYSDGITGGREIQMLGLAGTYSQQLIETAPYHRGILSKIGLELVPGPWLESISIIKGMGSVINGHENMTGNINLEFAKPKKTLDWFVNGYVSEIGKSDFNLIKGVKLNEKLYTNILAHTSFSYTTMDNNHDNFSDMPRFLNLNIMNKWHYNADNGFVLQATLQATKLENEAGQIGDHVHSSDPYVIKQNTNSYQALIKTGWELDAIKESSIGIIYRLNYAKQTGNIHKRVIDNNQYFLNVSPIFQTNLKNPNWRLKLGISSVYNHEIETLDTLGFNKQEWINGALSELSYKSENLTAILGFRADYHDKLGLFASPRANIIFTPNELHTLKISSGLGFRTPTYLTEAFGFLISNRRVILPQNLEVEKAWNSGIVYKLNYKLFGMTSTIEASYFLTLFQNQFIINVENPQELKLEYIKDQSRAQNFQVDHDLKINRNFTLKLSYKNDQTISLYDNELKNMPLLKNDKYLANLYWVSTNDKYRVSTTLLFNSSSRIPRLGTNPESMSPAYPIVHSQLNYVPSPKFDFYIGAENIFEYNQPDRIYDANNINSPNFDAGMIWGPMDVRRMYIGGKVNF